MIANTLLKVVMSDRPKLSKKKQDEFLTGIRQAIANNRFFTIRNTEGTMVGFFTFNVTKDNSIYINNLYILKQYRYSNNLLPLRNRLKKLFKFDNGKWFNHKRQREYNFSLN